MAHGLKNSNDIMYSELGGVPWHKLGIPLPGLISLADVREHAPHLFAPVTLEPAIRFNRHGHVVMIFDCYHTIQNDNYLGTVGNRYQVLQNEDACRTLATLCQDPNGPRFETVGQLWGGRVFWALASLQDMDIAVAGTDVLKPYLFLYNPHDSSGRAILMLTWTRVVCNNTAQFALSDSSLGLYRIRHSGDILAKMNNAGEALGLIRQETLNLSEVLNRMAQTEPTEEQVQQVLKTLIPSTKSQRAELQRERVMRLAQNGIGNAEFAGTAWSLLNAFTELEDHHNGLGSKAEDRDDVRFRSLVYGSADARKTRAFDVIREICLN